MAQATGLRLERLNIGSLGDMGFTFELRNNNREMFFDSEPITWEQHCEWHKTKFNDPFFSFLIIWMRNYRAGTIALESTVAGTFLQNLCVREQFRGRGIARWAITKLMRKNRFIIAQVKPDNEHVIKMYEELGFWRVK